MPDGSVMETYDAPHTPQHAPSFSGAPQAGHRISSTSPQQAHLVPPFGEALSRSVLKNNLSPTTYGTFDGQFGSGQYPLTIIPGTAAG